MCLSARASFVSERKTRGHARALKQSNVNFNCSRSHRSLCGVVLMNCGDLERGRSAAFVIFLLCLS